MEQRPVSTTSLSVRNVLSMKSANAGQRQPSSMKSRKLASAEVRRKVRQLPVMRRLRLVLEVPGTRLMSEIRDQ
jgi:hypothetical protein